ncbi:MAG: [FeFe] hydrogenase H-cluster radical SAM maturase HydE [bacterium]
MPEPVDNILQKEFLAREDILNLLSTGHDESRNIFEKAREIKLKHVGNRVYFRGLVEFSNYCSKNCYYCGIRSGNKRYQRYELTDIEVLEAARFASDNRYASMVIQSGERSTKSFVSRIESLLYKIHDQTKGALHITLSLGEQSEETYLRWFEAGAHRYLLRVEVSNSELYKKLHPSDKRHDHQRRIDALRILRKTGYQVGTGVMIGLPFQTLGDLAGDLLFFRDFDVDMVGMGPYLEHEDTPLYKYRDLLLPQLERFRLSLKMIAILRIIMKDINIAATTAMQTIDPQGREKALMVGANVIMPNLTPVKYRNDYLLYENKPCIDEDAAACQTCLETRIRMAGDEIGYGEWGDSKHFKLRVTSDE